MPPQRGGLCVLNEEVSEAPQRWEEGVVVREGGIWSEGKMKEGERERERCLCWKGSCSSLASQNPPVWRKYHQGNLVSLPLCALSSVPGLFLNSVWLPSQTKDYKPQHPRFVAFRIYQFTNRSEATTMFSSAPLPQLHCKLFAKMGDDRPFVCSAPGCGQVRLFRLTQACGEFVELAVNWISPANVHFHASWQFVLCDAAVSFSTDSLEAPVSNQSAQLLFQPVTADFSACRHRFEPCQWLSWAPLMHPHASSMLYCRMWTFSTGKDFFLST